MAACREVQSFKRMFGSVLRKVLADGLNITIAVVHHEQPNVDGKRQSVTT